MHIKRRFRTPLMQNKKKGKITENHMERPDFNNMHDSCRGVIVYRNINRFFFFKNIFFLKRKVKIISNGYYDIFSGRFVDWI